MVTATLVESMGQLPVWPFSVHTCQPVALEYVYSTLLFDNVHRLAILSERCAVGRIDFHRRIDRLTVGIAGNGRSGRAKSDPDEAVATVVPVAICGGRIEIEKLTAWVVHDHETVVGSDAEDGAGSVGGLHRQRGAGVPEIDAIMSSVELPKKRLLPFSSITIEFG